MNRDEQRVARVRLATALAVAQVASTQVHRITDAGVAEKDRARDTEGPVTPAEGAFAIWGPLFLASIAYAAGSGRGDDRVRSWMSAAFAADIAWNLNAQLRRLDWASVGLIGAAAAASTAGLRRAEKTAPASRWARREALLIGPLAGWLSVATAANTETTLNLVGGAVTERARTRRAVVLVGSASTAASVAAGACRGNPGFALAAGWGLGGIALKAARANDRPVAATALAGITALTTTAVTARRRGRRRHDRQEFGAP